MSNAAPATDCVENLRELLQSIAELQKKVVPVYSDDELMDATTGITLPAVGIVYEGMRAVAEQGSMKVGVSCVLVASLILLDRAGTAGSSADKKKATALLDKMRKAIQGKTSPTGHKWAFNLEAAADAKKGTVVWLQRWTTPIQLPPA